MSFEIQYDKNGLPIKQAQPEMQPVAEAETLETNILQAEAQEEVAVEETAAEEEVAEVQTEVTEEQFVKQDKPTAPQESWQQMRERIKAAERKAADLEKALQEKGTREQHYAAQKESDDLSIADDDLAEGKHLKQMSNKLKEMEARLAQHQQQSQIEITRNQLRSQYPDWDKVFTNENLAKLQDLEPEISYSLNSGTDPLKSGISAYKMIKRLGIAEIEDNYIQDKAAIQKNASKPKPMASIKPQQGDSPLSKANAFANGLTDELKAQMIREMQQARKGY